METIKATLPDLIHSRIEDLVNGQTMDEEMVAHMKELDGRIWALEALAREGEGDKAKGLAEDIQNLCARIRRDYVAIAYRQGLVDGTRLKRLVADIAPDAAMGRPDR